MDSPYVSCSNVSKELVVANQGRPVINLNVPSPKDVVGKVKVKTISSKSQVRYRSTENPNEFIYCDPQYKITRFWNASVCQDDSIVKNSSGLQPITYVEKEKDYAKNDPKSCSVSVDSKLSRMSLESWSSISLYEKALFDSFSCDSSDEEEAIPKTTLIHLRQSSLRASCETITTYEEGYTKIQTRRKKMKRSSSVPAVALKDSNMQGKTCSQKSDQAGFFHSSRNVSNLKDGEQKTFNKSSYSLGMPYNSGGEGGSTNEGGISYDGECAKVCYNVIAEKKLQYIMDQDPHNVISPKTLTRKLSTLECINPDCRHQNYFTGIGKVIHDALRDVEIFGVKKCDPNRKETRLRTTIMSEVNSNCGRVDCEMKSFIDRHDINDDISHCFKKLGDDQINHDDPSVLRVSEVVTVAQMNSVDAEELFKEKAP